MLLGALGANVSGNQITCKGVKAKILGNGVIRSVERAVRAGEGTVRPGQNF